MISDEEKQELYTYSFADGEKKGHAEGREEGREDERIRVAKAMKEMHYPLADIRKITGLDESTVEEL